MKIKEDIINDNIKVNEDLNLNIHKFKTKFWLELMKNDDYNFMCKYIESEDIPNERFNLVESINK